MREFSVPASYLVEPGDNITDDLFRNDDKWPDGGLASSAR